MRRRLRCAAAVCAAISMMATTNVLAVPAGYTGWANEAGRPSYYEAGVPVRDTWVKNGEMYYYIGSDGYVVPGKVICSSDISESYFTILNAKNTAPAATPAPVDVKAMEQKIQAQKQAASAQLAALAAARAAQEKAAAAALSAQAKAALAAQTAQAQAAQAALAAQAQAKAAVAATGATADACRRGERQPSEITSDYEAFKYLHPEIVSTYGSDVAGLYGKYMSTYPGGNPGGIYLATIARLYAINGNTPHYNQSYEDLHNGTHKAYTGSGEWIIESCDDYKHNSDGYRKCSKCGHVFKHNKLSDYQ